MGELRVAGIFYENRGPLVFSASLHLVVLVAVAIYVMVSPSKLPEDLGFILVSPPGASGQAQAARQSIESPMYESGEEEYMPTSDDIVLPERPILPEEPEASAEIREVEMTPAKPKKMTLAEFEALNGKIEEDRRVRNVKPSKPRNTALNFSALKNIQIGSVSASEYASGSQGAQDALNSYLARFQQAIRNAIEKHTIFGAPLHVKVRCDISAGGIVSNVAIVESSGDSQFDQKALDAFKRLHYSDPPPDGRGFRMVVFPLYQNK